jgi:predicted nucleic acid-binding protein
MEAEVRAILTDAVREPADSAGLFTAVLDRFGVLGGVELELPERTEPVDAAAAEQYAIIASDRERAGKPIAGFDALIAAVCRSRGAALATRNLPDFDGTGVEIIDPWTPEAAEI